MRCAWVSGEGLCLPAGKDGYLWGASLRFSFVSTRRPMTSFPVECSPLRTCMFLHAFFLGRVSTAMCWFSVWAGQLSNSSLRTLGRSFPFRSIDGWGSQTPFSSHRTVARRRISLILLLPCTSVSTACRRGSLFLSPSLGSARPKRGSNTLLPRSFLPALFLCATNPKGTKHSVSFPHRRGRTVSVPSRTFRIDGPRSSGGGGLGEEEARPDPLVEQIRTPRHRRSCLDVPRIRDRNRSWKKRERRGHQETRPVEDRHRMEGELIFSSTRPGAGVPKRNSSIDRARLNPFDRPFLRMVSTDRPLPVEAGRHRLHRIRSLSMGKFVSNRTRKAFLSTPWV